jgi:hypothetical protein
LKCQWRRSNRSKKRPARDMARFHRRCRRMRAGR